MAAITFSGTTATTNATWAFWNNLYTSCTTSTTTDIWAAWNVSYSSSSTTSYTGTSTPRRSQPAETPEQRAEREARHREQIERETALIEQRAKERAEAQERARLLLLDHLAPAQRESYEQHQHFDVISRDGQRRYRVTRGQRVKLINPEGRVIKQYCIHPRMDVPAEDTALAQKLMLESEEDRFLRVANAS